MIDLTRLNGQTMAVNCDFIKYAESSPDTVLTLVNGEKLVVLEPREEVVRRMTAFRAQLLADALKLYPMDGATMLASVATGAANLRVLSAEQSGIASEVPDDSEGAAQQYRRRGEK